MVGRGGGGSKDREKTLADPEEVGVEGRLTPFPL